MRATRRLFAAFFVLGLGLALPALAQDGIAIKSFRSTAAEGSHVFCDATGSTAKKAPCFLRTLYVTTGATGGWLMTFDAITAPANGAVQPIECVVAPSTNTTSIDFGPTSEPYVTGLTAVFSTTGCHTLTVSNTAFFKGRSQ